MFVSWTRDWGLLSSLHWNSGQLFMALLILLSFIHLLLFSSTIDGTLNVLMEVEDMQMMLMTKFGLHTVDRLGRLCRLPRPLIVMLVVTKCHWKSLLPLLGWRMRVLLWNSQGNKMILTLNSMCFYILLKLRSFRTINWENSIYHGMSFHYLNPFLLDTWKQLLFRIQNCWWQETITSPFLEPETQPYHPSWMRLRYM